MIAKATWISILIAVGLASGLWWWLQQTQISEALRIKAPREAEFSVPVYAQFTVTQTLSLPNLTRVVKLQIPIHMSLTPTGALQIDLRQNNQLLQRWHIDLTQYAPQANTIVDLQLPLMPMRLLEGPLEVSLVAPKLDAHFPDRAPRVLVENDDQAYPDGNYRIANNQKQGDVGLIVDQQRSNLEIYQELWPQHRLLISRRAAQLLAVGLLLIAIPGMLAHSWRQRPTN